MPPADAASAKARWAARRARPRGPSRGRSSLDGHHALAVELQLLDRLEDVGERLVLAFLREALQELGLPAAHELLECRDVEVAVMKVGFQTRHPAREEAAVLAD